MASVFELITYLFSVCFLKQSDQKGNFIAIKLCFGYKQGLESIFCSFSHVNCALQP